MKKVLLIVLFTLFLFILYIFFIDRKVVPNFNSNDINNNLISQRFLKGKVVLINFWYPSCPGCFKEISKLNNLYDKYGMDSNFKLIGISANYNDLSQVKEYVRLRDIKFTIIYDKDNTILDKFDVSIMPIVFLISKQGYIYDSYIGDPDWGKLESNIEHLLNQ